MVEATDGDKRLLHDLSNNLLINGSRVEREQLVATHREAAAKAERDRLRDLPDELATIGAIAGYTDEYSVKMIAAALADALESKP